jgi:hypothetical protein
MKKNRSRKSRIVTSRAPTASRYGVDAIETPPRNDERHGAERADHVHVELQPDDEEQERDAQLGEELELAARLDEAGHARPDRHPDRDVRDHDRQPQPDGQHPGDGRDDQDRGDLDEDVLGEVHRGERRLHGRPEYRGAVPRARRVKARDVVRISADSRAPGFRPRRRARRSRPPRSGP